MRPSHEKSRFHTLAFSGEIIDHKEGIFQSIPGHSAKNDITIFIHSRGERRSVRRIPT